MLIEVTQDDIDNGIKGDCRNCPVATAISRACETGIVSVSGLSAYVEGRYRYLPELVFDFVSDFDNGKPVKPFAFELGPEMEV